MFFSRSPSLVYSGFVGRAPPITLLSLQPQKPTVLSANETDASHHMAAVMELDLTAVHPNSLVDRLNAMPALKTSAAFFTFLRANLVIPPPEMASNVSTPVLAPTILVSKSSSTSSSTKAAKPAADTSTATATSLDDIPPLSLGVLTTRADKVDALKLVADSIAQQRQTASRSLVFHPLNLAGLTVALGIAYQLNEQRDLGTIMTVLSGITMTYLLGIRYLTSPYIPLAEALDWSWLTQDAVEDTVIGARFGEEMIGALVLHIEPPTLSQSASALLDSVPSSRKKDSNRGSDSSTPQLKGGHGVIRAFTTKLRYRRRGIGSDLLSDAVRVTRERCGKDATVELAKDHANSKQVLPEIYNGPLRANDRLTTQMLENVLAHTDGYKKR